QGCESVDAFAHLQKKAQRRVVSHVLGGVRELGCELIRNMNDVVAGIDGSGLSELQEGVVRQEEAVLHGRPYCVLDRSFPWYGPKAAGGVPVGLSTGHCGDAADADEHTP